MNNEKVWSHDFEEIALAIALLGGLLAFIIKLINYFNENIILWSESTQRDAYFLVGALLLEFLIILLFFILKGILASTKNKREDLEEITTVLFKGAFIFPLVWFVTSLLLVLFYYIIQNFNTNLFTSIGYTFSILIIEYVLVVKLIGKEELKNASYRVPKNVFLIIILTLILALYYIFRNNISIYMYSAYSVLVIIVDCILFVELVGREELKNELNMLFLEKIKSIKLEQLIVSILIIILFMNPILNLYSDVFLVAPSILLMGSFSIEDEFPQSIDKSDVLTVTIKETGLTYSKNYITLSKWNAENKSFIDKDNITLPIRSESENKLMFGGLRDKGVWELNINTSNLQAGTYRLNTQVTNDFSKNSIFGTFKKNADKLFYITPKNANYSFNST